MHNLSPAKKPKGRFFWYAFGIYKPKEPSLWFLWFATEPLRGEWWRKKGNAGRCLGLALGVGVLALEAAPHYSGGRLFQHREFILFNYLLFGELHCAVAVNGLHDVDA